MKLNTVLERMPLWYSASVRQGSRDSAISPYLKSPPGRGKTTTIMQAPAILSKQLGKDIGMVVINGGMLNEMDAIGYLIPVHSNGLAKSVFTLPPWWITQEGKRLEEYAGGIIFIDEEDKAPIEVKKILGEARLSGRVGPHVLPPGWVVWGAGNRAEDRSGSTKELDHLISRRMEIGVDDDIDSLSVWMQKNHCLPLSIAFVHQHPNLVFVDKPPEKQGPWCTPRSLVQSDEYLRILTPENDNPPDDPIVQEEITGKMGGPTTAAYFAFVKLERNMPKFERIIADPKGVKVPDKADAQMLVCYNLAHRVTEKTAAQVITYVERMPKDFSVTFATAAVRKQPLLVAVPAFDKWCSANASLMAAITSFK